MNSTEFDKWANDMIKRVDYKKLFTYRLPPENWEVVVCYNKRTGKIGIARCHPKDRFNLVWGKAIATARCLGIEVPKMSEYKKAVDMKNGEIFIDSNEKYRFIGECKDFEGRNAFAIQNVETERIKIMKESNVKGILYEMVE